VQFLQLVISGIAQGCIYGLIALGFVLIYKATETVSFAQGDLMMLGAFGGLAGMTMLGFPFWLAVIAAIGAMGAVRCAAGALVIRPILGQPAFSIVMLTIGIGYVARGLITMIPNIGTETHTLPVPYKDRSGSSARLVLNVEQMVVIAVTAVLCAGLLRCSATASSAWPCRPRRRTSWPPTTWAFRSSASTAWCGAGRGGGGDGRPAAGAHHLRARQHGLHRPEGLPAAVVGGFGSLPGAIVGGLIIGIVESLSGFYLPEGFKDIAPYIVVLIMLMVKPNGLFGEKLRKKV
jgi:branched-chain amino acid transport system permease protein